MKILLTLSLLTLGALAAQDSLPTSGKQDQHKWLQQLVGKWESNAEMQGYGTWKTTEEIRAVGGLWILTETNANFGGQPFTSLMTLGYDPRKGAFVGSWVDSLQTTMWSYVGQLDDEKRILTLEAEGPSMTDPNKTAKYRDQIELIDKDHKRMISSTQNEAGEWTTFMTVNSKRVE